MNNERYARLYLWLHPDDCDPPHGLDLSPGSRDLIKVEQLEQAFAKDGFDPNYPALVGYPCEGKIQLLSGTHRHEAAKRAGIRLPVRLMLRSEAEATWGTDDRAHAVRDVPLKDLECVLIDSSNNNFIALADRVDPESDITWR